MGFKLGSRLRNIQDMDVRNNKNLRCNVAQNQISLVGKLVDTMTII